MIRSFQLEGLFCDPYGVRCFDIGAEGGRSPTEGWSSFTATTGSPSGGRVSLRTVFWLPFLGCLHAITHCAVHIDRLVHHSAILDNESAELLSFRRVFPVSREVLTSNPGVLRMETDL